MDNIRIILWLSLLTAVWFAYGAWVSDYSAPPPVQPTTQSPAQEQPADEGLPQLQTSGAQPQSDTELAIDSVSAVPERSVRVITDVFDLVINLDGGDLVRTTLLQYPVEKSEPDVLVRLLDYTAEDRWIFQTGLLTEPADDDEPNHQASFTSAANTYTLNGGANELRVVLDWENDAGVQARKIYTFTRGSYEIDLTLEVDNATTEVWRGAPYSRMVRQHNPVDRSFMAVESYSTIGPAFYDGDKFEKLDFDDLAEQALTTTAVGGWFASIQHHFLGAIIPPTDQSHRFTASTAGQRYTLTALQTDITEVAPGTSATFPMRFFVGPKLQDQLTQVHDKLDLAVDYGILTFLAHPLFLILKFIHGFVGNWGWSIVITTFLIKLAFYKLTATSGRSMAKMRKLAPRMKTLQERYKDDRQALSQAMMELYKKEKVNPAAGCLPILIQMPFFFAYYWVLIESAEMRQAPFMFWIDDLSKRDPFFVLPLLMGAAMFFQTRLNPAPPDPVQARIMQIMPLAFTAFLAFFPSGLVLYWLTNTALSILQQWRINKMVAAESS